MDSNFDIVPTLRMFDGVMMGKAADEIERLRARLAEAPAAQPQPVNRADPVEVAIALEQQRALHIVQAVRKQGFAKSDTALPTQAESVFDLACEEIEYRLQTEVWELGGVAVPVNRADTLGWKLAMRVLQSDLYPTLEDDERAECDALVKANPYIGKSVNRADGECIGCEGTPTLQNSPCAVCGRRADGDAVPVSKGEES